MECTNFYMNLVPSDSGRFERKKHTPTFLTSKEEIQMLDVYDPFSLHPLTISKQMCQNSHTKRDSWIVNKQILAKNDNKLRDNQNGNEAL
mmetsp:Transcript_2435/g.2475  ORF Transcript_2435/g.2475 Transcript_2435/m.2475 type:complete len:90 (-) Transcript_2435:272-541(-)